MINLTKHAIDRAKERLSWNEKTLQRMAERAWELGVSETQCKGRLETYIDTRAKHYVHSTCRIYGEYLYIYGRSIPGNILITVYDVPSDLTRLIPK